MNIDRELLNTAVEADIIDQRQADTLYKFLQAQTANAPGFSFTQVLYYLGGLIAIGAMTLFMGLGWASFGGWALLAIALSYSFIGILLANHFRQRGYHVAAGIVATFVITLMPAALFGLMHALGWWPIDHQPRLSEQAMRWRYLIVELGTLSMGLTLLWFYRYPFMLMPVAVTLWLLSLNAAALLIGDSAFNIDMRSLISVGFGSVAIVAAITLDLQKQGHGDYAFWFYLIGVAAFWGGLTALQGGDETSWLWYLFANLLMLLLGAILVRRVFAVFAAFGIALYLGHLAATVFADSLIFPVALAAIGLSIVYLGILWQRHEAAIGRRLNALLPPTLRQLLAARR